MRTDWLIDITNPELGYLPEEMAKFKELPPSVSDKLDAIQRKMRKGKIDSMEVLRGLHFVAGVHHSIVTRIPGAAFFLDAMIVPLLSPLGSATTRIRIKQKDDGRFLVVPERGHRCKGDYNGVRLIHRYTAPRSTTGVSSVSFHNLITMLGRHSSFPLGSNRCSYPITDEILSGHAIWDEILVSCHICGPISSPVGTISCRVCSKVTCADHTIYPCSDGFRFSMCLKCAGKRKWSTVQMYASKDPTGKLRLTECFIPVDEFKECDIDE